jgi:hypothetical protein
MNEKCEELLSERRGGQREQADAVRVVELMLAGSKSLNDNASSAKS